MKRTPVMEAYERSKLGRQALHDADCRRMECTEDKAGIVWERFLTPAGASLVLVATPHWWDVFKSVEPGIELAATLEAIRACASAERVPT